MYQQFSVILDGAQFMQLSSHTSISHKSLCTDLGIFEKYDEQITGAKGAIGGSSDEDSKHHLLTRYLNSASRTQAIVCIEDGKCEAIQLEVLYQLSFGEIHLIDIAAGHGAGTVSLLNTICDMRREGVLKNSALDVVIHAIDYSPKSLEFYGGILASLNDAYLEQGISVGFNSHVVDITCDQSVSQLVKRIKGEVGRDPTYLLLCSAISGIKEKLFREKFAESYEMLSQSFKEKNSSFLWIEPRTPKAWMQIYWKDYFDKVGLNPDEDDDQTPQMIQQEYHWIDPHNNKKVPPSFADYLLVKLA